MGKIVYDFDIINTSLESINVSLNSIDDLIGNINSLSVDISDLVDSLSGAKKSLDYNVSEIYDVLTLNRNKSVNLINTYQQYESDGSS